MLNNLDRTASYMDSYNVVIIKYYVHNNCGPLYIQLLIDKILYSKNPSELISANFEIRQNSKFLEWRLLNKYNRQYNLMYLLCSFYMQYIILTCSLVVI